MSIDSTIQCEDGPVTLAMDEDSVGLMTWRRDRIDYLNVADFDD